MDPALIEAVRQQLSQLGCDVEVPDSLIIDFLSNLQKARWEVSFD